MALPHPDDTICAISTPTGAGGLAVVRISGPGALAAADSLWRGKRLAQAESHTAHLGTLVDPATGEPLDQCVATIYRAPRSFTGDDVVELSIHGSRWLQREAVNLLVRQGCRVAEPGEFTRRGFAAGKMDLLQAEAVADVIASTSRAAHRMALSQLKGGFSDRLGQLRAQLLQLASLLELELDFSEEDVEFASRSGLRDLATAVKAEVDRLARSFSTGQAIKEGIPVAIAGAPNAGKSTLLNLLLGDNRAIVSDIPGTTRDTVEDTAELAGRLLRFIDTAGLRDTADTIETLGIERTLQAVSRANTVIWMLTDPQWTNSVAAELAALQQHMATDTRLIAAVNKTDLNGTPTPEALDELLSHLPPGSQAIALSAATGQGLTELHEALLHAIEPDGNSDEADIIVSNARHYQALLNASESTSRVIAGLDSGLPGDLIAQDLRETLHHLADLTGQITTPDILHSIFSRFCIGK